MEILDNADFGVVFRGLKLDAIEGKREENWPSPRQYSWQEREGN